MLNVVGLSAYYHDSACCLLQDGVLTAAAQEERFSRKKHDRDLPNRAFRYCLEEGKISVDKVDCIAYYENPIKKLGRQLWSRREGIPDATLTHLWGGARNIESNIRINFGYEGPIEFFDHHLSHAASSYYYSGFGEAAVLTVDGVGEWATTTYGHGSGKELEIIEEVQFPDSLGLFYSALSSFLGFAVNDGEYKVMGLAPYGCPVYTDQLRRLVQAQDDGQFSLALDCFDFTGSNMMFTGKLADLLGHPPREPGTQILDFHKDLARSLQTVLEEVLLAKVAYLYRKVKTTNLCMAGGVALNCVANSRIARESSFRHVFIQPAAGDAGTALGAAALAHIQLAGNRPSGGRLVNANLGPAYCNEEIRNVLAALCEPLDYTGNEDGLIEAVVDRLARGKVVGWFQGRMEFGPRALGARSILADPRDPNMRDLINSRIKKREEFRPFAPATLLEMAQEHFQLDDESPFMLRTCQVKSPLDLPAITHVDGSARIQTVDRKVLPRFARLLGAFGKRTGCPILLNTSFNMRDEPIVCSPSDALICFIRSNLETLAIQDFLIDREQLGGNWEDILSRLFQPEASNVTNLVYTFV